MTHTDSKPVILLRGVRKVFHDGGVKTHALHDIDLEIGKGEYISISGPSGCGKTTLLCILGLLDSMTSGEYLLEGVSTSDLSRRDRARVRNEKIGFIFQAFNLIGDLTVAENVELPLSYRGLADEERHKRVDGALGSVGLMDRANHYPTQLSGGQQQRAAVARAIAGNPAILLADEPTGNLDSANGESVMKLLKSLNQKGTTICMVTHDPRYAQHADRSVGLFDGRVL